MNPFKNFAAYGLSLVASIIVSSAALALPLGGVVTNSPSANESAIKTEAQRQMTDKDTRFKSVQVENEVFEGLFIPASTSTKLAVVSDDGVTVTIDGAATNITNFGSGQSDKEIDRVFKVINTPTFVVGRSYRIKVDYSNTIHADEHDFDGMTIFAFNGGGRTQEVNLIISRGQNGYAVPDDEEESVGAFTVANRNDTDNNNKPDHSDNNVPGEKDLMALEISRPAGPATDKATVKVTNGNARLWQSSTKGTPVPLVNGAAEFTLGSLPKTIYVETTTTSPTLRSISIELDYKGNKDTVKATGVWAEVVASELTTRSAPWVLADTIWSAMPNPPRDLFEDEVGGTGLTSYGIRNAIIIKFGVLPAGVGNEQAVAFDVTRQASGRIWEKSSFTTPWELTPPTVDFPANNEEANDDIGGNDESNPVDANGHLYVIDAPGFGLNAGQSKLLIWLSSFREFVRVSFDGVRPSGARSGSRCSDKYKWHCLHYAEAVGGEWRRIASSPENNTIALGEIDATVDQNQ